MKTRFFRGLIVAISSLVCFTSCIYEGKNDPYYRTLWLSSDPEFGAITVDFLCDNVMAVKTENGLFDDYGTYSTDGRTAFFDNLMVTFQDHNAILVDADRNGDELTLNWYSDKDEKLVNMKFVRLSSYDQVPDLIK